MVAREDALHEDRELGSHAEHHLPWPVAAQLLRRLRRADDVLQGLVLAVFEQFGGEPDFEPLAQGFLSGGRDAVDVGPADPDGVAMQVMSDDPKLTVNDARVEDGTG